MNRVATAERQSASRSGGTARPQPAVPPACSTITPLRSPSRRDGEPRACHDRHDDDRAEHQQQAGIRAGIFVGEPVPPRYGRGRGLPDGAADALADGLGAAAASVSSVYPIGPNWNSGVPPSSGWFCQPPKWSVR